MPTNKRRHFLINKRLQAKYGLLTFLFLLIYTLLFFCLLLAPYFYSLAVGDPLQEQAQAARMLLNLHETIWPVLAVVIGAMSCTTIYITHRIAGPAYRLKQAIAEVSGGNLDVHLNLRKKDDLKELAAGVNGLIDDLRIAVQVMDRNRTFRQEAIATIEALIEAGKIDENAGAELLRRLTANQEAASPVLDKYRL